MLVGVDLAELLAAAKIPIDGPHDCSVDRALVRPENETKNVSVLRRVVLPQCEFGFAVGGARGGKAQAPLDGEQLMPRAGTEEAVHKLARLDCGIEVEHPRVQGADIIAREPDGERAIAIGHG
ncbi:hypothetical protein GCM10009550_38200 [Actinocorallia libanotica]|uniref:Uncharacterized protein n=1 Tax=Actinocorallia libanotica TaxID=46162 RepID=A0ABP4BTA8_9ACTN